MEIEILFYKSLNAIWKCSQARTIKMNNLQNARIPNGTQYAYSSKLSFYFQRDYS